MLDYLQGDAALSQQAIPYAVPAEPGHWRSVLLSLLVHLALLAFLWIGVSWQSLTPTTVEAEIWDANPRDAAPPRPEPEPVPEPPKPLPEPKPPAPVIIPEPPKARTADPEIALEQEKKRQREKERLAEEQEKKEVAEDQKRQKEELALKEKKKLEEEQKRKQETALAEEQKRKQEQAVEKPKRARSSEDMDRILGQVGDGEAGTAEKKSGAPGSACELYIGKTVKSNTSFPDMPGTPVVTVRIKLSASRMLEDIKVVYPSEHPAFDRQVERGLRKSGQFPAECPEDFTYSHSLKPR